ncbi:MAG: hypothetical protein KAI90_03985 [Desulfobulbaceae bacterium]|nr:hypothetical protein [Desulfobulbaceae bacterium]
MKIRRSQGFLFLALLWYVLAPIFAYDALALCARVQVEIRQEATLERQAFDAHLQVDNGLEHAPLENVAVDVFFTDENGVSIRASSDPNDIGALFFIRLDNLGNIDNVDGTGVIDPAATADIHWQIIPAPGASNGLSSGTLYYVGATLSCTIGGEEYVTEVLPDYIFVKPMPAIHS